jgi:hypothetical protein
VSCNASFSWSQDEFTASALSFDNTSSHRLTSRAETETLNPHHHHRPLSLNRSTPTLYYYKKVISTLITLLITQLRLYFTSSLDRASCHRTSTRRRRPTSIVTPHNDTHGDEIADPLSLSEQLIDMWIHVKNILKFHSIAQDYQLVLVTASAGFNLETLVYASICFTLFQFSNHELSLLDLFNLMPMVCNSWLDLTLVWLFALL